MRDHTLGETSKGVVERLLANALRVLDEDPSTALRCLAEAARLLAVHQPEGRPEGFVPWQLSRVRAHVELRLSQRPSRDAIASELGISASHFGRNFRRSFGETFARYVQRCRVNRALVLMATTDHPLKSIALECGFSDQPHMTRAFRDQVGVAPNAWRRDLALSLQAPLMATFSGGLG
jgi:AraC-like DNA-binding protein